MISSGSSCPRRPFAPDCASSSLQAILIVSGPPRRQARTATPNPEPDEDARLFARLGMTALAR
jgi:hypothetical protein